MSVPGSSPYVVVAGQTPETIGLGAQLKTGTEAIAQKRDAQGRNPGRHFCSAHLTQPGGIRSMYMLPAHIVPQEIAQVTGSRTIGGRA